jgi:O-antigen biosynthesis protein
MGLIRRINNYRRVHGIQGLLKRLKLELFLRLRLKFDQNSNGALIDKNIQKNVDASNPLNSLNAYLLPSSNQKNVFIITDSIGSSSLFGGVGTAIILGVLAANNLSASLKIITRTEPSNPADLENFLNLLSLRLDNEVAFIFAPPTNNRIEIGYSVSDIFITTSWWTTSATMKSIPLKQILYLLQEDERMFYAFGDERLRCDTVLRNPELSVLINTKLLFDHFISDGTIKPERLAIWFEPSFPSTVYRSSTSYEMEPKKRRFFFYARPNNPRNLYEFGINLINQALDTGVMSVDEWDIYIVGKNIPEKPLGGRCVPIICEGLDWKNYAALIRAMDLGLCLMYTPHPSYPPLDLVASGAVVVTNAFGNKMSLENYSKNIVIADLSYEALLQGLSEGIAMSKDGATRKENFKSQTLLTDWEQSFLKIIAHLAARQ